MRWPLASLLALAACGSSSGAPPSATGSSGDAGADAGPDAATPALVTYTIPFDAAATLDESFRLHVSVGGGPAHEVVMDTGSTGLVVPASALGPGAQITTEPFSLEYTSSGIMEIGHWAVAPVRLGVPAGYVAGSPGDYATTVAMRFGVVETVQCDPSYPACSTNGDVDTVGVMGVGFDRDVAEYPSATNPFLQVAEIQAGAMHAGYVVSQHPPQVVVGLDAAATTGFRTLPLAPKSGYPGEWDSTSVAGCVTLPALPSFGSPCGRPLVDTGIAGGILTMPAAMLPTQLATQDPGELDVGVAVEVTLPAAPAVATYSFVIGAAGAQTPDYVYLRDSTDGTLHINTSRHLLAVYDYLFDARDGAIGFRPAAGP
jgi:hypothetical protein